MFPLYNDDRKPLVQLSLFQKERINELITLIQNKTLKMVENRCICGNEFADNDIVISEKDRFGIPAKNLICSKCGLIRCRETFDDNSNAFFYENYYRDIYVGDSITLEDFFKDQNNRGIYFFQLLLKNVEMSEIDLIIEIGCGAGGVLYPFHVSGHKCFGVDYDKKYLDFGIRKGLNLVYGDYHSKIDDESASLIILSHVMEHFICPIEEMQDIVQKIKFGGYLLIEVPGIFYMNKVYLDPLLYLQNAHVYNYYSYYLNIFFKQIGLKVIYGDERCCFILQKPTTWNREKIKYVYDVGMQKYPDKIKKFIIRTYFFNKFFLNPIFWEKKIIKLLDFLHLKKTVKKILGILKR